MKFNKKELELLEGVLDYHADQVFNDVDDHDRSHVNNFTKLLKLIREKKNG
jgi:DNA topoisomerase IB